MVATNPPSGRRQLAEMIVTLLRYGDLGRVAGRSEADVSIRSTRTAWQYILICIYLMF